MVLGFFRKKTPVTATGSYALLGQKIFSLPIAKYKRATTILKAFRCLFAQFAGVCCNGTFRSWSHQKENHRIVKG